MTDIIDRKHIENKWTLLNYIKLMLKMEKVVIIWLESFSGREIHGIKNNEYGLKTLCL